MKSNERILGNGEFTQSVLEESISISVMRGEKIVKAEHLTLEKE